MKRSTTIISGLILAVVLCAGTAVSAQQKGFEGGLLAGTTHYFGDLNPRFYLGHPGIGINACGRYNFNNRLAAKLSLNYGRVNGDDSRSNNAFQQARNLSFKSNIWEAAAQMEFNFFPYEHGTYENYYTPYVFLGFSVFRFNPRTEMNGEMYELRDFGTEGQPIGDEYKLIRPALVYGVGMKWDLNYNWSLNFEISGRSLSTDYLDDVSSVYPDLNQLAQDRSPVAAMLSDRSIDELNQFRLGEAGRQRGNSKSNDSYVFISVGLMYYFGQIYCPTISKPENQL